MKQGKTLQELATELQRQKASMRDFRSPTNKINFSGDKKIQLGTENFGSDNLFIRQIANWANIPVKYVDRMAIEAPELLAQNMNHWLQDSKDTRLIRTLDGNARAFLSHRYRMLDNVDVISALFPVFAGRGVTQASADVTDKKMYLKVVNEMNTVEVKLGDKVQFGVVVTNSEVGLGAVKVEPLVLRLVCMNGAIVADAGLKRFHIGRQLDAFDEAVEVFKDETVVADNKAFYLKLRDVVNAALDTAVMEDLVKSIQAGTKRTLGDDFHKLEAVVELVGGKHGFSEAENDNVLKRLIAGNEYTQWGLANAVTRVAQDTLTYERATELETAGGSLMTLDEEAFEELVNA